MRRGALVEKSVRARGLSLGRCAWGAVLSAALACAWGCTRPQADNLLLVSFDTTRADHIGIFGGKSGASPNIDALGASGAVFRRAYSNVPSTLPAHSTMFTGKLPAAHGVRCNGKFVLAERFETLAEILSGRGFATGAVLGAFPLERRFGLLQGFDYYDDDFASSALTAERRQGRMDEPGFWIGHDFVDFERSAEEVSDRAIGWLDGRKKNWFLFAHYFDPHWPYEPAPGWDEGYDSDYAGEIAYADHHLARLLEAVAGTDGRTLIVFTADHGEGLGEHGEALHNRYLYNSTMQIPLAIALPGVVAGAQEIESPVSHVDLLPTVLDLLGQPVPESLDGRSLAPLLARVPRAAALPRTAEESPPVYGETLVWSLERPEGLELRSVVRGRFKLIENRGPGSKAPAYEFYDLGGDPREEREAAMVYPPLAAELRELLTDWSRRQEAAAAGPSPLVLDEAAVKRLQSLGYL